MSGQQTAVCDGHRQRHLGLRLQPGRHAARLGRRRPGGAPLGPGHRRTAGDLPGTRQQGHWRCVPPGRSAPGNGLVGRDGTAVGRRDRPGDRTALRPSYWRGPHRRLQPRRAVGRLGGAGPDRPGVAGVGPAGRGDPARPHGWRGRGGIRPGRSPAGLPQSSIADGFRGGRHGAGLGRGPAGDPAYASRPLPGHLPGGLQPGRPLDRLGGPGRRGATVGRGDRRAVRDPASPWRRVGSSVQPGRDVAVECKRPGRPAMGLGRGDGSRPQQSPGSRRKLPLGDRPPGRAGRWPRRRSTC